MQTNTRNTGDSTELHYRRGNFDGPNDDVDYGSRMRSAPCWKVLPTYTGWDPNAFGYGGAYADLIRGYFFG